MRLISELKRRNVLRMAVLYAVAAWLVMQVAEVLIGLVDLPPWLGPAIIAVLAVGFPIALIVSWFYELTPEGLALDKDASSGNMALHAGSRRADVIVIAMLAAAVILFAYDKWWPEGPMEQSVAVLPFVNLSADPEQEYFSDGISEEILNLLAQMPELRVISRSSAFYYKGKDVKLADIARELNVAHVLEGSVRKAGKRVRITAQLIEARSDTHLWSQTYDRTLDDIFAVQDEIAAAIGDALKLELALPGGPSTPPTEIKATNSAAYDAYLRGRELMHERNRESIEAAIEHLERALRLDESYAPAHAQLAIATMLLTSYVMSDRQEARRKALRHLDRAQALEPDLAEAHAGRALLAMYAVNPEAVVEHARKALTANPNYIDAMAWLYNGLMWLDRQDEAREVREQMRAADPRSVRARMIEIEQASSPDEARKLARQLAAQHPARGFEELAVIAWNEGRLAEGLSSALRASRYHVLAMEAFMLVREYDEARRIGGRWEWWIDMAEERLDQAVQKARNLVQLYPDSVHLAYAAEILYRAGRLDEALPLYERALELAAEGKPIPAWSLHYTMQLALSRRKAGDEESAQAAAETVRRSRAERGIAGQPDLVQAYIAAFEHDMDRAIAALESSVRKNGLRWWPILDDPIFEELWDEPRFVALRQELDAMIAEEHEKVLQLICFNNPVPDDWQPMPETCEGVEKLPE